MGVRLSCVCDDDAVAVPRRHQHRGDVGGGGGGDTIDIPSRRLAVGAGNQSGNFAERIVLRENETLSTAARDDVAPPSRQYYTVAAMTSLVSDAQPRSAASPTTLRVSPVAGAGQGTTNDTAVSRLLAVARRGTSSCSSFVTVEEAAADVPVTPCSNPFRAAAAARHGNGSATSDVRDGDISGGRGRTKRPFTSTTTFSYDGGQLSCMFDPMQPAGFDPGAASENPLSFALATVVRSGGSGDGNRGGSPASLGACARLPGLVNPAVSDGESGLRQGASNASMSWEAAHQQSTGCSFFPAGDGSTYSLVSAGLPVAPSHSESSWAFDDDDPTEHQILPRPQQPPPLGVARDRGGQWRMPKFNAR